MPDWSRRWSGCRNYDRAWLPRDVVAGLTTSAVVLPKAMAFAALAGLPVQAGLYTALVPVAVYAVLGSSRRLSVSSTTTIAILTAAEVAAVAPDGDPAKAMMAASTLAVMVGLFLVLASVLRLGFLANFVSDPVLTGFKAGLGVVIVVDQIPKLLGIHIQRGGFFENVASIVRGSPESSLPTLAVAAGMLALMVLLPKLAPRVPAPLAAVAAGIGASGVLGLGGAGVAVVGPIPAGLPGLAVPDGALFAGMWTAALGIALMSSTESIAVGRAFARLARRQAPRQPGTVRHGVRQHRRRPLRRDARRRRDLSDRSQPAGRRPQPDGGHRDGCEHRGRAAVPGAAHQPHASGHARGGGHRHVGRPHQCAGVRRDWRIRRVEFRWAAAAMAGVTRSDARGYPRGRDLRWSAGSPRPATRWSTRCGANGDRRSTGPWSSEHADDEAFPGLLIRALKAEFLRERPVHSGKYAADGREAGPSVVLIDFGAVPDIEYTALRMLVEAEERLRGHGIELWLARLNPAALDVVQRSTLGPLLGRDRMFFDVHVAVETYLARQEGRG